MPARERGRERDSHTILRIYSIYIFIAVSVLYNIVVELLMGDSTVSVLARCINNDLHIFDCGVSGVRNYLDMITCFATSFSSSIRFRLSAKCDLVFVFAVKNI